MLKTEDIEQFYRDVDRLGLKFPGAAIAGATGHSKSNVSKYLNRKLEPSESFLNSFYEKFPKGSINVSRETDYRDEIISLLKEKISSNEAKMLQLLQRNQALLGAIVETLPKLVSKLEKIKLLEAHEEMNKRIEHHLDVLKKENI